MVCLGGGGGIRKVIPTSRPYPVYALRVHVGPYLSESVGELLLLLRERPDAHHGVGVDPLGEVRVINHKYAHLVPYSLLAPGQGNDGGQGSDCARGIRVDGLTGGIDGVEEEVMLPPSVPVRHGWIVDLYPTDGARWNHDRFGGAEQDVSVNLTWLRWELHGPCCRNTGFSEG